MKWNEQQRGEHEQTFGECPQFLRETCGSLQAFAKQTKLKKKKKEKYQNLRLSKVRRMLHCCKRSPWLLESLHLHHRPVGTPVPTGRNFQSWISSGSWVFERLLSPTVCQLLQLEITKMFPPVKRLCQQLTVQTGTRRGRRRLEKQISTWFLRWSCFSWHMSRTGCLVRT